MKDKSETIRVVRAFQKGDVVFVECHQPMTDKQTGALKSALDPVRKLGIEVVILAPGLRVVGREEAIERVK